MTHQQAMPGMLTEKEWQRQVIDLAHIYGWRVAHFRPAMTKQGWRTPVQADGAGFPDLVLVRLGELVFAELKTDKGKTTEKQDAWLADLATVPGVDVFVWRPGDFDEVHARLARR